MKINYRPEIDGLRAIAVVAVILYHAQITIFELQPFKGGFIGVDIFFVISGYLITSIILKELLTTGYFSFSYFYERRIRRILPVLLLVIMSSLPFAWMYLLPTSLEDFLKSVIYSLGFSSNFYFHFSGQQYGAASGLLKPFLHTWSLAVEEQFYILFPIFLIFIFKYFKKFLFQIFTLVFIISLVLSDFGSKNFASLNFYLLTSRIWEILAGSILAYLEIKRGKLNKNKSLSSILPSIGLILIIHSIFSFNDKMFHPSIYTLSPILGVCLIIWYSNKDELVAKILSTKLFVGCGLVSYSLYLWHYPIFAFARITDFVQGNIYNKLLLGITIIILSVTSYFFIEKPFRNKNFKFFKIFLILLVTLISIISFSLYGVFNNGKLNNINIFAEKQILSPLYRSDCKFSTDKVNFLEESFFKNEFLNCKEKYKNFILVLGDSHSIDLFNSVSKISKKSEFIIGLNRGGCRPSNKKNSECHYMKALDFIKKNQNNIKLVLFTHKGSYFLTENKKLPINDQLNKTILYLSQINRIINNLLFVGPHLEPNIEINRKTILKNYNNNLSDKINYDLIIVDKKLKELSKKNNINYLSKIETLKFDFEKDFIVEGNFTFSDTDHWNDFGEIYFGKKLIYNSVLGKILFPEIK